MEIWNMKYLIINIFKFNKYNDLDNIMLNSI